MAGTPIFRKRNNKPNSIVFKYFIQANTRCCLGRKQSRVVKPNNHYTATNNKSMRGNLSNYKNINFSHDGILTLQQQQKQRYKQHPLTLRVAIIILPLTVLLIQLPEMVYGKSIYEQSSPSLSSFSSSADYIASASQISAESKMLLTLLAEENERTRNTQQREDISSLTDNSSSINLLTSLDILRHTQHTRQHQKGYRMRLRKRHTGNLIITKYLDEKAYNLEWKNPCNVDRVNAALETPYVSKQQVYKYLKKLERDLSMEYLLINATANTINIFDIAVWNKYDEVYKFLPKLNTNGSIALSRWYRNMQVYVASFGYLARLQYKFDTAKQMFAGDTSEELNKLMASARFVLCELETTINGSAPNNNLKKLKTISRKAMNNRLDFITKHQQTINAVIAANSVDLKFAKYSYFQYLINMQKILNRKLQHKSKAYGFADSSEKALSSASTTIVVGNDSSNMDFNSIFRSDSSLSLGESVEVLLKPHKKKSYIQKRRNQKRKITRLPEA